MNYFHKLYYTISSSEERDRMVKERYNYHSTIKTGLEIKPMDQPKKFELFYVPTNNTMNLIQEIMSNDKELDRKYNMLPGIAKKKFFLEIIVDELYNTNDLEGVRSSRKEIAENTKSLVFNEKPKSKRFNSMIVSYLKLTNEGLKLPRSPKDIRKIYDNITHGEIKSDYALDGKIFRKDISYVYNKGLMEIHRGIYPEEVIIEKIEDLLDFMNNEDNEVNYFLKIAIGHYYFAYIHPFYDGNGRTGRFISSLYLREKLSMVTALSLARGCNMNRNNYLKIFDVTNKIISRGELNYFVDEFLNTLVLGQKDLLAELNEKIELLDMGHEKIINDTNIETKDEFNIMYVLVQDHYFSVDTKGITIKELVDLLGYSDVTVRKKLKTMEDKGLVKRIKSNPLVYVLPDGYLEG